EVRGNVRLTRRAAAVPPAMTPTPDFSGDAMTDMVAIEQDATFSTFTVAGTGPGLIIPTFTGTFTGAGDGTFALPINRLGAYSVSVTKLDDIDLNGLNDVAVEGFPLSFTVGATCTPPPALP